MTGRIWLIFGAVLGAGAVVMAAVAAHALPQSASGHDQAAVAQAVQMQAWHALALVAAGLFLNQAADPWARWLGHAAGAGFALGSVLFCGAIYAHHLGGLATGAAAPWGGSCLILAWLVFAFAAARA